MYIYIEDVVMVEEGAEEEADAKEEEVWRISSCSGRGEEDFYETLLHARTRTHTHTQTHTHTHTHTHTQTRTYTHTHTQNLLNKTKSLEDLNIFLLDRPCNPPTRLHHTSQQCKACRQWGMAR